MFAATLLFVDQAQAQAPAVLVIRRAANFGTIKGLRIWVDGQPAGSLGMGREFRAGISPGNHIITVVHTPNWWNVPPTNFPLRVRSGRIYQFTAVWHTDHVVLE